VYEIALTPAVLGQALQLTFLAGEREVPHPPARGPDRHRARLDLPRQTPVVEGLGRPGVKRDRLAGGLLAAL
jgi:hypothetical protein